MKAREDTLTDDQMRTQRVVELRRGLHTDWDVVYAIDRVRGHATVPEREGDRRRIAEAINATRAAEVRSVAGGIVSRAALGGRAGEALEELVAAALAWAESDQALQAADDDVTHRTVTSEEGAARQGLLACIRTLEGGSTRNDHALATAAAVSDSTLPAVSLVLSSVLAGDVIRHTNSRRRGCVVQVGQTHRDGTTEYCVRPARDPDLGVDLAWWSSAHVRREPRRDPYRRYLLLVSLEDDPGRQSRRQAPEPGRGQWRRRARSYGPWLPDQVWEKMYWRLCNLCQLDAEGNYVHYDLGREHWRAAATDCLERRDRAARWWMRPRPEVADSTSAPRATPGASETDRG